MSAGGGFTTIHAINLRLVIFFPFQFLHERSGENITFSTTSSSAIITSRFIVGFINVVR